MHEANPSIMSHVSAGTSDLAAAAAFYDTLLATIGAKRVVDEPFGIAYGREFPEFWIAPPHNGQPATPGNGVHFAFLAANRAEVDAFHAAGMAAGATDEGKPGPRPHYGQQYYGAFMRDADGNKIEAMAWEG